MLQSLFAQVVGSAPDEHPVDSRIGSRGLDLKVLEPGFWDEYRGHSGSHLILDNYERLQAGRRVAVFDTVNVGGRGF